MAAIIPPLHQRSSQKKVLTPFQFFPRLPLSQVRPAKSRVRTIFEIGGKAVGKAPKTTLMLGFSIVTHLTAAAAFSDGHKTPAPRLIVRVSNYAQVPLETQSVGQRIAARIFHRAGIETSWLDCSLTSEGKYRMPDCEESDAASSLALRLVPASPATVAHFGSQTLGVAAQPQKGTPAIAGVFYDRVQKLARGDAASTAMILGHAMAHELGHLLLGTNSHSPVGLMRAQWNSRDLQLASAGDLDFTAHQAASLREELVRRSRQRKLVADENSSTSASRC